MSCSRFVLRSVHFSARALCSLGVLLAGADAYGSAQTRIQYYTTFMHENEALESCHEEGRLVSATIDLYDHPETWRWIVVCDWPAWQRVEAHLGRQSNARGVYLALTEFDQRLTYIRGDVVLHPLNDAPEMQLDQTVRHELAHILLKSGDCRAAERYAARMLVRLHAERVMLAENEQKSMRKAVPGQ